MCRTRNLSLAACCVKNIPYFAMRLVLQYLVQRNVGPAAMLLSEFLSTFRPDIYNTHGFDKFTKENQGSGIETGNNDAQ